MAKNKVVFGGETIIDLTDTTAEASDVAEGKTFYDRSGEKKVGTKAADTIDQAMSDTSENAVQNKVIKEYVDGADENLQAQIDALGEPFRVKQWASNTLNVQIPMCSSPISNTEIDKMVFRIDDVEGAEYQIVGMIAYEVFDAASGGNRINCWPVCQFTGNGQKELSVRWMCGGTLTKVAKRINAWVLLKHR